MQLLAEPLYPYCGCMTDNLASPGLCRACWDDRLSRGGACEAILLTCGTACSDFLDNLETECGPAADPTCLEAAVASFPNQVDDIEALLGCLCGCAECDTGICQ
jgi:hypothetical protein